MCLFYAYFFKKNQFNQSIMSNSQTSSVRKHKCDKCNKNFTTNYGLQTHINSIHLKVKFDCEFCDYQSTRKSNLKQHVNSIHLKLKPFQCDECDYSCGQAWILKQHVDSVHKKIRFHCSFDGCDKSFTRKGDLNQHLKLHEGQVNLCDQCGKTFSTKAILPSK